MTNKKYFLFIEQDDQIQEPVSRFVVESVMEGWLEGKLQTMMGNTHMAYYPTDKAIAHGFYDPRELLKWWIKNGEKFSSKESLDNK